MSPVLTEAHGSFLSAGLSTILQVPAPALTTAALQKPHLDVF